MWLASLITTSHYSEDILENKTLPRIEGLAEIKRREEEFITQDINEIEGRKVVKKVDYKDGVQGLPPSNVIKLFLEDGSWVVIRPSGNEPKIKYYKNLWKR